MCVMILQPQDFYNMSWTFHVYNVRNKFEKNLKYEFELNISFKI